jgi:hypothetical protein
MTRFLTLLCILCSVGSLSAQQLRPGFDGKEYRELLEIFLQQIDTVKSDLIPAPARSKRLYRSPESELKNRWELWKRNDGVGIISIRGTTSDLPSWLENFYAAMIPASGELQLDKQRTFRYQLSKNPKAAVHVGWTVGLADLSVTLIPKIREQYAAGVREFLLMGHSQGGALAFLARSYLADLMEKGELPKDLRFKTYCSAAPKPGNLYYAYEYEFLTRGGWSFTVLNSLDWVPETAFSLQTLSDFNDVNPFKDIKSVLKKQKFLVRLYGNRVYNHLNRSTRKSERRFRKYLGKVVYSQIRKFKPDLVQPKYVEVHNYTRAGVPVILAPDDKYPALYPDSSKGVFTHHFLEPYYYLSKRYYPD